jgi:hypothetical protein
MLRTKATSCLKPRLLSGSARCYTYRRAHGALTRELSEGAQSMTERDDHRTGSGGARTTSGTSWTKPPGEAGARETTARRPPPGKRSRLAPGGSKTLSRTS